MNNNNFSSFGPPSPLDRTFEELHSSKMAPRARDNSSSNNNGKKKPTIVTISDFRRQSAPSNGGGGSSFKNAAASSAAAAAGRGGIGNDGFCQPVGGGGNPPPKVIPTYVIPSISKNDVCEDTLKRIMAEFDPIIRRRGYNVRSVSELCCCGDGLDSSKGGGRKRKLMSHNVLGYNMTSTQGRRGGGGGYKSHTIHLRLRNPRDHTILFPYEDVAGTMAHELAHCVHGPHDDKFFALMEEIMEEHDRIRIYGPHGPSFLKPTNLGTIGRTPVGMPPPTVPFGGPTGAETGSGHRLGGQGTGKSRLIDLGGSGRKLGGGESSHGYNPRQLRELALQAAERRKNKMDRFRRAIEQAKTPCVIDLTNDDDDEDQGKRDDYTTSAGSARIKSRNKENDQASKKRPAIKLEKSTSSSSSKGKKRPAQEENNQNKERSTFNKGKSANKKDTKLIDLTADDDEEDNHIDVNVERFPTDATKNWTCATCTYINTSNETECEVCFTPQS